MATIPKYVLESMRKATKYNRMARKHRVVLYEFLEKLNLHEDPEVTEIYLEFVDDDRDEDAEWLIRELENLIKDK